MVVDYVLCPLKHKYFDEDSELSFDEIIEQVQGTDLPLETKEWLREVMKPVEHMYCYDSHCVGKPHSTILFTDFENKPQN